jgi:Ca-activated chloride channel homolog
VQASVRLDHSMLAVEDEHDVHAMLELVVPEPAEGADRPPLRLALVLDRSGSMAGPKVEVAKRCAGWLIDRLRAQDELALVDYDDEVRLLAPLAPVRPAPLRAALAQTYARGTTNLSGGWLKGLEQLRGTNGDGPRKILLLTDGLANVGITEPNRLVAVSESARRHGVGTSTIGFGDDFDEDLLTAMADAGGGNAHYAATPEAAPGIFARELEGLSKVVAQNVSLEIRPTEDVEVLSVLNEYPQVIVEHGVQLELGDAYGGERRRVVFALHVPHVGALGPAKVADLVLRYVSVGEEIAEHELTIPVAVNLVSASEAAASQSDLEVREEVLILQAAQARDRAIELADAGEYEQAQKLLRGTASELRRSKDGMSAAQAAALEQEALELDQAEPLAAPAMYSADASARKRLRYDSNAARRRRR